MRLLCAIFVLSAFAADADADAATDADAYPDIQPRAWRQKKTPTRRTPSRLKRVKSASDRHKTSTGSGFAGPLLPSRRGRSVDGVDVDAGSNFPESTDVGVDVDAGSSNFQPTPRFGCFLGLGDCPKPSPSPSTTRTPFHKLPNYQKNHIVWGSPTRRPRITTRRPPPKRNGNTQRRRPLHTSRSGEIDGASGTDPYPYIIAACAVFGLLAFGAGIFAFFKGKQNAAEPRLVE